MTRESLEIILRMWTDDAPWTHNGKFWTVTKPDTMFDFLKPHLKPLQAPHPPIGVAGLSKGSDTLKLAGERGYIPMSLNLNPAYVTSHWDSVLAGAAKTGRKPSRQDWRLVREVCVADTDEEAWKLSTGDMMGRMMGEYFLPLLGHFGFKDYLKHAPDVPDSDVTDRILRPPQLGRRLAVDGSREDRDHLPRGRWFRHAAGVRLRLQAQAEAWHNSLRLLKQEVMPRLKHLTRNSSRRRERECMARGGGFLRRRPAVPFSRDIAYPLGKCARWPLGPLTRLHSGARVAI